MLDNLDLLRLGTINPAHLRDRAAILAALARLETVRPVRSPVESPESAPSDLLARLAALPAPVQAGDLIERRHYNALRDALLALAELWKIRPSVQEITATLLPAFLPVRAESPWTSQLGYATAAAAANQRGTARGWLPLSLPEGAQIRSMKLIADRDARVSVESLLVQLHQRPLRSESSTSLITIQAVRDQVQLDKEEQLNYARPVALPGEHIAIVLNDLYKYFVEVQGNFLPGDGVVRIYAIQVVYWL